MSIELLAGLWFSFGLLMAILAAATWPPRNKDNDTQ